MKRDCSTCVYKEGSCYPSTTIFDKDKTCKSYDPDYEGYIAELEKENAKLKEKLSIKDILIKELQEQKVYWKESSFDWRHKFFKLDKVKRLIKKDDQLTKAKFLLKKLVDAFPKSYSDVVKDTLDEARKFVEE